MFGAYKALSVLSCKPAFTRSLWQDLSNYTYLAYTMVVNSEPCLTLLVRPYD